VIKIRRIKWKGQIAHMGRGEMFTSFWWGNMRERHQLENPGVDGKVILRLTFRNVDVWTWT
jgi:hypothetical protein